MSAAITNGNILYMMKMNLFMSAVTLNGKTGICAINIYYEGKYIRLPEYRWTKDLINRPLTAHNIMLVSLKTFLKEYASEGDELTIYTSVDSVCFEWNHEHIEDGKFYPSTQDKDLWEGVIQIAGLKKLSLSFKGSENTLSSIAMLSKKHICGDA